jgi:hypothetical protein
MGAEDRPRSSHEDQCPYDREQAACRQSALLGY